MLPGFSAEQSLYQSCAQYVSAGGGTSGAGEIAPAATSYCISGGGKVQCGEATGWLEGAIWGGLIGGAIGGGVGGVIGGAIGAVFCWIFGCD
jgi:hypothetical protein